MGNEKLIWSAQGLNIMEINGIYQFRRGQQVISNLTSVDLQRLWRGLEDTFHPRPSIRPKETKKKRETKDIDSAK